MVRGSGAAWDLRKAQPYECYAELDFDIPIGKNGDCYDRYLIRMEEMRQSIKIMKQCIDKLRSPEGQGPVSAKDNKIVPPKREILKNISLSFYPGAKIGAPDGPFNFTPSAFVLPVYCASCIVCIVQSFSPVAAFSATTAPCGEQHSCFGFAPEPTPEADTGTMTRSL
jgi:hypothetical protein